MYFWSANEEKIKSSTSINKRRMKKSNNKTVYGMVRYFPNAVEMTVSQRSCNNMQFGPSFNPDQTHLGVNKSS